MREGVSLREKNIENGCGTFWDSPSGTGGGALYARRAGCFPVSPGTVLGLACGSLYGSPIQRGMPDDWSRCATTSRSVIGGGVGKVGNGNGGSSTSLIFSSALSK